MFKKLRGFLSGNSGNIAATFGIALIPITMGVGAAIDYTRATQVKNRIANATDAALLAAVSSAMQTEDMNDQAAVLAKLNAEFAPFFQTNIAGLNSYQYHGFTMSYDPATGAASVDVDVDYDTAVWRIFGQDEWDVGVVASTNMSISAGGAFSIFLVMDRSGSMGNNAGGGVTRMASLQTAVGAMITDMKASDPDKKYIRMGAVAYSSYMWNHQNIKWNLTKSNNYTQAMTPGGGTDSSDAVNLAYNKLKHPSEVTKHQNKTGQDPELVMIFMTDGNNNHSSSDTATLNTCTQAKNYGIVIYTVAFQAPSNGQALLSACATDAAHYFEPDNTQELIDAFKNIGQQVGEKLVLSQ